MKRMRDAEKTRAKILEVAFNEIYRHGFQGVSVDDIVAKTGLTKGAFFHHFKSKQALGHALIDETLKDMVQQRWLDPLERHANPIEGIVKNLKNIIDEIPEEHLALGCPLNNLVQEMSGTDAIFRRKLKAVLEFWIDGIAHQLQRARTNGQLKAGVSTRQLAEFVVMNHEGAFGMIKSLRDRQVFRSLHAALKAYLKALT